MIRRSPAENYFKYLVVHPDLYTNDHVRDIACELGLDYLGDWYLTWLRHRTVPPSPFFPDDRRHDPSRRFLLKEGLEKVFHPTPDMRKAIQILSRERWREVIETLLILNAPVGSIVHGLKVRCNFNATDETIRLYKFFFWDIDVLSSAELRALLDMRFHGALHETEDRSKLAQFSSLARMRHTDSRVVAARMPSTPLASLLAQMQLGVFPKKVNIEALVDTARTVALTKVLDSCFVGGPQGAQMGQGYALIADIMTKLKESVVDPEANLRDDLRKLTVASTSQKVPYLPALTQGRHTTNVQPDPKSLDEEEDDIQDGEFEEMEGDPAHAGAGR